MRTRTRCRRALGLGLAAVALTVAAAPTASAVGVDGVDLRLDLPRDADGRHALELGTGRVDVDVVVTNRSERPREVRVYAAGAERGADGGVTLGDPASSASWMALDAGGLSLAPEESRTLTARVHPRHVPADVEHVAVLLEAGDGAVVTRAATVVPVRGAGEAPFEGPVTLAVLLLGAVLLGHLLRGRGRVEAWLAGRG